MKAEARQHRRDQIMDAAIDLLIERGYRETTMLAVARRAGASKETLYAWFGDKGGLFEAIIQRNAATVQQVLDRHLAGDAPMEQVLTEFGRALLSLLLSDNAVAINRAAISESSADPSLARTLARSGRDATLPAFVAFLEKRRDEQEIWFESADRVTENFLGLLLGDTQVRRLLGELPAPGKAWIRTRAADTTRTFLRLYNVSEAER
jgi:AcrR family transcriptional regulator